MTEQEKINENLQRQIDAQTARIDNVLAKVDMLVVESQQQREDIRRAQEKHDAEMHAMNEKCDLTYRELTQQLHTNFVQTMIGVGAIMAAIGGLIIATLKQFWQAVQPRMTLLPMWTRFVSTPSASKTLIISLSAILVLPFALGEPLIKRTFMVDTPFIRLRNILTRGAKILLK